ncbi:hypothetical protein [Sporisorium scitamineum]|uniref:Uncharacterized protein n=1 Tax=Sporisorium scitamineum TaxID=49012 RepID=A0A0F7RRV2_9BASI|nr:hypothetical protein [Sporisorium scitamineum]
MPVPSGFFDRSIVVGWQDQQAFAIDVFLRESAARDARQAGAGLAIEGDLE